MRRRCEPCAHALDAQRKAERALTRTRQVDYMKSVKFAGDDEDLA
jgi:hypothetical protein